MALGRPAALFQVLPVDELRWEDMSAGRVHDLGENLTMATRSAADSTLAAAPLPDRIRHRFPIFERRLYVNSCSQGALSDAVRAAYEQYLADWDEKGAPWEYWVERGEAARATFARLVNAAPDEVAVTTSLSAGVSALASGLRYARRSKVVRELFATRHRHSVLGTYSITADGDTTLRRYGVYGVQGGQLAFVTAITA